MAARGNGRMPCHRPGPARPLPGLPAGFPGQSRRAWVRSWLGRERASPDRDIGARGRRSRTRPGSAGGCSAGRPRGTGVINREGAGGAGARSPGRVAPRVRAWRVSPGLQSARRCGESGPRGRPTWVRLALAWPGPGGGGHRDCPRGICGMGPVVPRPGPSPCHPRLVPQCLGGSRTRSADELLSVCYGRWPWDWCHPGRYGPSDAPQGACGRPRVSSRCPVRSGTGHRTPGAPPARRDGQAGRLGPCRTPSGRAARADDSMRIDGAESHQGRACWIAGSTGPPLGGGERRRPVARNG